MCLWRLYRGEANVKASSHAENDDEAVESIRLDGCGDTAMVELPAADVERISRAKQAAARYDASITT
jgi:hypothetical protein